MQIILTYLKKTNMIRFVWVPSYFKVSDKFSVCTYVNTLVYGTVGQDNPGWSPCVPALL